MKRDVLHALLESAGHRTAVLITNLRSGDQSVVFPLEEGGLATVPPELATEATEAVRHDEARTVELTEGRYLVRPFNPPVRVILVGAVHIAQALAPMITLAGLSAIVVDPRPAWTSEFRFPDVRVVQKWPDEAFAELNPDHRTAVVTLTHDPKVDDPALARALEGAAFYVGALGSRRTHARRAERLREAGFRPDQLDRIHAPVGLDIGARTPPEIAVAILGDIIKTLRASGPTAG